MAKARIHMNNHGGRRLRQAIAVKVRAKTGSHPLDSRKNREGDRSHPRSPTTRYCLNPIQLSETTSELPGLCGSYFTDVGNPSRQECKLIHWRRYVTSLEKSLGNSC